MRILKNKVISGSRIQIVEGFEATPEPNYTVRWRNERSQPERNDFFTLSFEDARERFEEWVRLSQIRRRGLVRLLTRLSLLVFDRRNL